jgi:23S rRNA pseudouridine2605 synthase
MVSPASAEGPVRLQKYLAEAGVCSRRAAETLIANGEVTVNGQIAVLGTKITPGADRVTVSGEVVRPRRGGSVTLAVNKPRGLVCTNSDPHHQQTIFDLLPAPFANLRLFCAGRLDKESEGLVILTTDGELANRLMHPSGLVIKYYRVSLEEPFPKADIPRLLRGVVFEGERLKVERARLIGRGETSASTEVDVEMHHGKKREIRQLFTTLGCRVKRLRRYQIGRFSLRGFPSRAVKVLTNSEIASLLAVPRQ